MSVDANRQPGADDRADRRRFQTVRGTNDTLPDDQPYWDWVRGAAQDVARRFGFRRIDTPVLEETALFLRTIGEGTDIVEKEMYTFRDRGEDLLTLRPEGTAPVCRAYIQHGMRTLPQPVRAFYITPIFRYERPQSGRLRQHYQFGAEAIGDASPEIDAEVIHLLWSLLEELGLGNLTLHLNSIGDADCRPRYLDALRGYYAGRLADVCDDCHTRYEKNPLRLLDCKQERCQPSIQGAPTPAEGLCADCADHFDTLRSVLDLWGIPYRISPTLVRGLDYYTRTVFEVHPQAEGSQTALGAGGRYDGLIAQLGGPPTPGVGFGSGIERIIMNLRSAGLTPPAGLAPQPDVYIVYLGQAAHTHALRLSAALRGAGLSVSLSTGHRSLRAQLRAAGTADARYALILGDDEIGRGAATLRLLETGDQRDVPLDAEAVRRAVTD